MQESINTTDIDSIDTQIAELKKKKLLEQRKIRLMLQKQDLKRKIIELNVALGQSHLRVEDREPIYKEIIKAQEALLFISGYYAKLLNNQQEAPHTHST